MSELGILLLFISKIVGLYCVLGEDFFSIQYRRHLLSSVNFINSWYNSGSFFSNSSKKAIIFSLITISQSKFDSPPRVFAKSYLHISFIFFALAGISKYSPDRKILVIKNFSQNTLLNFQESSWSLKKFFRCW
jgi:hypothetical protein